MRRVLVLTYNWPPLGGSGVQHPLNVVRRLPDFGWEPIVVAGPAEPREPATALDPSLADEQPVRAEVQRVPGPQPASDARERLQRRLLLQTPWERWWVDGLVEIAARHEVDAVYAWAQPYATLEAGAKVAQTLGRPWIADLSDPWALDEMWFYPTALHRRRELRRMQRALGSAAAVVMSAPEAAARVRRAFPELREVTSAPFGYDAAAFAGDAPTRTDDRFRIVHVGELHTEIGVRQHRHRKLRRLLGGEAVPGADVLPRSPIHLLRALDRLEPALRGRIELHLAGRLTAADEEAIAGSPIVRRHGYVPHAEAVALMRSADLLFLPMQALPPGTRAGLVPGKTYEYLASGRPILAAVPEGDARDLLREAGTASIVDPADKAGMAAAIRQRLTAPKPPPTVPEELLERYEYASVTRQLATILDDVVQR